jgi:hypothetical protein
LPQQAGLHRIAIVGVLAQIFAGRFVFSKAGMMAEINKLSVEKALEKLRGSDSPKSKNDRLDEKEAQLDEEIRRMREQRLRIERHQRSRK